jgi:tight adherence protein C
MSGAQLSFLLIVFGVVVALAFLGVMLFAPSALRQRLGMFAGGSATGGIDTAGWAERVARVAKPLTKLSVPEEGWEGSALRLRFMNAGLRNPAAPTLYFASKTLLALLGPLVVSLALATSKDMTGIKFVFALLSTATCGYYLPNVVLSRIVVRRKRDIFESLPDGLDLLTVCVEAGLSLERALVKVADEIGARSPVLATEIQLLLLEMRAGFTKEKALRNFSLRTGVEDVETLVTMLIQSERFGTTVGDALRVHSDTLRTRRRLLAEERAAKIGLKLLFPLIFFIFPTLLMVLMGPAIIQVSHTLLPALNGVNSPSH